MSRGRGRGRLGARKRIAWIRVTSRGGRTPYLLHEPLISYTNPLAGRDRGGMGCPRPTPNRRTTGKRGRSAWIRVTSREPRQGSSRLSEAHRTSSRNATESAASNRIEHGRRGPRIFGLWQGLSPCQRQIGSDHRSKSERSGPRGGGARSRQTRLRPRRWGHRWLPPHEAWRPVWCTTVLCGVFRRSRTVPLAAPGPFR